MKNPSDIFYIQIHIVISKSGWYLPCPEIHISGKNFHEIQSVFLPEYVDDRQTDRRTDAGYCM